jgi:tagatose-6-phosphate ketose/aldose isomerase
VRDLADAADCVLNKAELLRLVGYEDFDRAVYLGSGALYGAAREAALKMLEMSAGRVITFAETYLGLRHGPMSAITPGTLVVCFLSSQPHRRAYELDLLRELRRKCLGRELLMVGSSLGSEVDGTVIELPSEAGAGSEADSVVYVVAGQLLAYNRCLKEGLDPDAPSGAGVITRVVESFPIH